MLVFFDIDATLLVTDGMGVRAMLDAGRDLFGAAFNPGEVPYAGRLDPLIIHDLLVSSGIAPTPAHHQAMRRAYAARLRAAFDAPHTARPLPGAVSLVSALWARGDATLAILTGNFAETGSLKLDRCGLAADGFHLHVWGDHSPSDPPTRDDLPRVGVERFVSRFGRRPPEHAVWVVGDTPHDVKAARVNGQRSLGVATGRYSEQDLRAAGAEAVLQDLADTDRVLSILLSPGPPA